MRNPKQHFGAVFGCYPQNEIFFHKIQLCQFITLQTPNFMQSFRKIPWAVLEKINYWLTDKLAYWQSQSQRTPFCLMMRLKKTKQIRESSRLINYLLYQLNVWGIGAFTIYHRFPYTQRNTHFRQPKIANNNKLNK